jgi:hypothetical protein
MSTATDAARVSEGIVGTTWLREVCLEAGAQDVGFVEIDRPAYRF